MDPFKENILGVIFKKPIRTSNLAMRFYVDDGWTKEELEACLEQGEIRYPFPDDLRPYFVLDHTCGSRFDVKKLLERTSEIRRGFPDQEAFSDEELIERFNWG